MCCVAIILTGGMTLFATLDVGYLQGVVVDTNHDKVVFRECDAAGRRFWMDDLERRILTTVQHARHGLGQADARFLERRILGLYAEVGGANYEPAHQRRLLAYCSEAHELARWALGRTTVGPGGVGFRRYG